MSLEITHGDLLKCPCGCGVPDVLCFPTGPFYVVFCEYCDLRFESDFETDAVQAWNRSVRREMAGTVA